MGRIVAQTTVENTLQEGKKTSFSALVDTGATYLTLPAAWKDKLGEFKSVRQVEYQLADQKQYTGELCGPATITIEGFSHCYGEVFFMEMIPEEGECEPLLGYVPLEQLRVGIDMLNHRLVKIHAIDVK